MFKRISRYFCLILILSLFFLSTGCVSGEFEVIAPPVKDFPTPGEYKETTVISGPFTIEKSFRGNKGTNVLTAMSDTVTIRNFTQGEKGVVTYEYNEKIYKFDAVLTSCPEKGYGLFMATYTDDSNVIPDRFPGLFSVLTFHDDNCLSIVKSAVLPIDDNGNAVVLQIDENGLLIEKNIVIGLSNDTHYHIISGIEAGEKVVIR